MQSGFRFGYSCVTALTDIIDDIIRDSDKGQTTVILLDFSKTFDTINHEILLSVLHFNGFSESVIEFIHSYLSDRFQYNR